MFHLFMRTQWFQESHQSDSIYLHSVPLFMINSHKLEQHKSLLTQGPAKLFMRFIAIMIYSCHACDAISHLRLPLRPLFHVSTLPFMLMRARKCFNSNRTQPKICVKLFMSFDSEAPINHEMEMTSGDASDPQKNTTRGVSTRNWAFKLMFVYVSLVPRFSACFLFSFLRFYVAEKLLFTISKWRACESLGEHVQSLTGCDRYLAPAQINLFAFRGRQRRVQTVWKWSAEI